MLPTLSAILLLQAVLNRAPRVTADGEADAVFKCGSDVSPLVSTWTPGNPPSYIKHPLPKCQKPGAAHSPIYTIHAIDANTESGFYMDRYTEAGQAGPNVCSEAMLHWLRDTKTGIVSYSSVRCAYDVVDNH